MKKTIEFIKNHLILVVILIYLVLTFIDGYKTKEWNFIKYSFVAFFLIALFSPMIRNAKAKKQRKEEADYLAKKIAEEINKEQP